MNVFPESIADELFKEFISNSKKSINTLYKSAFPPYDIIKTADGKYVLKLAIAGFSKAELDITVENGLLTITGSRTEVENNPIEYLHKGISSKAFKKQFALDPSLSVDEAKLKAGLLEISLHRENNESKKIAINSSDDTESSNS